MIFIFQYELKKKDPDRPELSRHMIVSAMTAGAWPVFPGGGRSLLEPDGFEGRPGGGDASGKERDVVHLSSDHYLYSLRQR